MGAEREIVLSLWRRLKSYFSDTTKKVDDVAAAANDVIAGVQGGIM